MNRWYRCFAAAAAMAVMGLFLTPAECFAATYYVRPDGGSRSQCTGRADAPYPGQGSGLACAWDHPFRALPPGGAPFIAGGDTLSVADGAYKMGYGARGAGACDLAGSYDCLMAPIPSGPSASQPTRILGAGWNTGCSKPPILWGSGRPWFVVNLTDSSNVLLACFEITDHSGCVEAHTGGLACNRDTPPYGDWASYGLHAQDSANVTLRDLDIHGLAAGGVHAGRLRDWTVERVRIAGNGSVGWDGDLWDNLGDANSGRLTFRRWLVEWNGCGETYPGRQPIGCWGQEAGGYGDGVGTGETGGDWLIEDSAFLHNTSDGLDLLYHTLGGTVVLNRVHAEGNAGNQVKTSGPTTVSNSVLVGNCAFFEGKPFTYWVDHCRALGATLVLDYTGGERNTVVNSTLYGQGDGLVSAGPREGFACNGSEKMSARNSLFLGDTDYTDPTDISFLFYQEGCGSLKLDSDYDLIHRVKDVACGAHNAYADSGAHDLCRNPRLTGPLAGLNYGMLPAPGSPAIDTASNTLCAAAPVLNRDQRGKPRPVDGDGNGSVVCDRGAYEVQRTLQKAVFISVGTYDGWIVESGENSAVGGAVDAAASTFRIGDDALDRQYRGILHFATAGLPDGAVVTAATVKIKLQGLVGTDPLTTHGSLLLDIRKGPFSNTDALQSGDFQAPASLAGGGTVTSVPAAGGWYSGKLLGAALPFIHKAGATQLRLRFQRDDNDDLGADYLAFFSGNAAAYRPQLIVEYYVP